MLTGLFMAPDETLPSLAAIVPQTDAALVDYRHPTSPTGTMTIVFTDIERSTELMERVGEQAWLETLLAHHNLVRGVVARCGGDVVKSQGDGFMLAFGSASSALSFAVELQRAIRRFNAANRTRKLCVRVGVHTGNILRLGNDFLGKAVVLAARITGQARGGEVLVSAASKKYTDCLGRWHYGSATSLSLKGLTDAQRVYSLDWQAA